MLCLNARQKNNTVRIARNADVSLVTDYHNATVGQARGGGIERRRLGLEISGCLQPASGILVTITNRNGCRRCLPLLFGYCAHYRETSGSWPDRTGSHSPLNAP